MLQAQRYRFLARPRIRTDDPHAEGVNCRSLIQDYFCDQHHQWLNRDAVEQPGLWERTGTFIPLQGIDDRQTLAALPHETVLLAERTRDATGQPISRGPECFDDLEQYRFHLHTALLIHPHHTPLGRIVSPEVPRRGILPDQPAILHATAVQGSTCLWGPAVFTHHYRLVAAKTLTNPDHHQ